MFTLKQGCQELAFPLARFDRRIDPLSVRRRLTVIGMAVLMGAFALSGWVPAVRVSAPGYRAEHSQPAATGSQPSTDAGRTQAEAAGIDIDAVVEKVSRRVVPAEDGSAALSVRGERYLARFDADGFALTLDGDHARLGVSLNGVERGGEDVALVAGPWRGEANVAVRAVGRGMTERVTARNGELEWDVVLARPLPGTGDLRLHAEVHGLSGEPERIVGSTALRLPLGEGRAMRMGELVVKDATGTELYRALPQASGQQQLSLAVPASVLARAQYPLTIDPTVSPEFPVTDPVAPGPGSQENSAVAWNGTNYLVVWQDDRFGVADIDIFGARVTSSGAVLDPGGFSISGAANNQVLPAVAWDTTNFLVVWEDRRAGNGDIYGARVTSAGGVLDPTGFAISTAANDQTEPALAWSGTNYLVTWGDDRSAVNLDIWGARVTNAGTVTDATGFLISGAASVQTYPSVAWNGANFLVAWADARSGPADIYGSRVTTGAGVLNPTGIAISTAVNEQSGPSVASDGTNYMVVWHDERAGANVQVDIWGARVTAAGSVTDATGFLISNATSFQIYPAVAWNGTNYLVVWHDRRSGVAYDIYGSRVTTGAGVLDGPPATGGIPISTATNDQQRPAVAVGGTTAFVTWTDGRSGTKDVFGARVNSAASVLDAAGVPISTNTQSSPGVAFDGTNFLVVWEDNRSGSFNIYGARVSPTGTLLDATGIPISIAVNRQDRPTVIFNGTNFLVVWEDFRSGTTWDIYAARVSTSGSVFDPTGIAVSTAVSTQSDPAVSWNGTDYLVTWEDARLGAFDIFGTRVSAAGTVLDPAGIAISTATDWQLFPAVAWNGTNFLVVWTDFRSGTGWDTYGARVSGAGSVLEPAGIPISTAANNQYAPAVASWGESFLVVWADNRSGTDYDIYGAGVSAAGIVQQPTGIAISAAPGDQDFPELHVRYNFLVVWRDHRSGTNDVYGARVSPAGAVEDPAGFLVAGSAYDENVPKITGGPGATWGVVYDRVAPDPPYGANRVFLRTVAPK